MYRPKSAGKIEEGLRIVSVTVVANEHLECKLEAAELATDSLKHETLSRRIVA